MRASSRPCVTLGEALTRHPEDARLLYLSAYLDYLTDQFDGALATLTQVLSASPEDADARQLQAVVLAEQGNSSDAELVWIGLLREYPEEPRYLGGYARLMLRALNLDKARRLGSAGLSLDPDDHECLCAVALCDLITGGADDSGVLIDLLRKYPDSASSALLLVVALKERGDLKGAHRVAQQLFPIAAAGSGMAAGTRT